MKNGENPIFYIIHITKLNLNEIKITFEKFEKWHF